MASTESILVTLMPTLNISLSTTIILEAANFSDKFNYFCERLNQYRNRINLYVYSLTTGIIDNENFEVLEIAESI